jgi:undecaprenyl-diphosphatase
VAIQSGAMLAVIWEYRERLARTVRGITTDAQAQRFALNVLVAFLPAAVLGLLFGKLVKTHLFHPVPVALAFIVGGLIILWSKPASASLRRARHGRHTPGACGNRRRHEPMDA